MQTVWYGAQQWKSDDIVTQRFNAPDALPFGRLWYARSNAVSAAVDYAKFYSRSHDSVIRVYDDAGNIIETHAHKGDFKEP